ncbi:hypothetical protein KFE25_012932 [Diacronema lutheri]|uniref:Uncharacterized protein n=1 Tax=Diacronema lutheri TaxID=2081491 RepID=A0A8J5XDP0_DIALT|nr:hypothetical protein KFE25_012932 [Diacronema lutheri]
MAIIRFTLLLFVVTASAHVCSPSARAPSALCAARRAPRHGALGARMIFGGKGSDKGEYDLTDLGPLTKEKRAAYKADRTPKTEYVPDNLAWDGSSLYVLMVPFLVVVCLSLFGGVNFFGYSE